MALNIGDNFSYLGAKPLDSREVFASKAALDAVNLSTVYEGMVAYAKLEDKYYRLKGTTWVEFASGSGGGIDSWTANTAYVVDDIVINNSNLYICTTAHTSGATFDATELANWKEIGSGDSGTSIEDWATSTAYDIGDIVIYANSLYRCNTAHTSGTFSTDVGNWDLVFADLKSWSSSTYYYVGTVVIYGNTIYKCTTIHTSSSTFDESKWQRMGERGLTTWATSIDYEVGNIVIYAGSLYRCTSMHTSTTFSSDVSNWTLVYADIKPWTSGDYYTVGTCVVDSDRIIWKCITAHTAGLSFDSIEEANWEMIGGEPDSLTSAQVSALIANFNPAGDGLMQLDNWEANHGYTVKQVVYYGGSMYRCKTAHTSGVSFDATEEANWDEIVGGSGGASISDWVSGTNYAVGDFVIYQNKLYKCITANADSNFTPAKWQGISIEDVMTGATALADGTEGLAPKPQVGDEEKYLRGDGTWNTPSITELAIRTDILWEGGSTAQATGDVLTLTYPYTNYDRIRVYLGTSTSSTAINEFVPSKEAEIFMTNGVTQTEASWNYMQFSGSSVTLGFVYHGTNNTNYIKRIEGIKFTTTTGNIQDMTGATASTPGVHGLVPQPSAGDINKYLAGDGTWKNIGGSGANVVQDVLWDNPTSAAVPVNTVLNFNYSINNYDYLLLYKGNNGFSDVFVEPDVFDGNRTMIFPSITGYNNYGITLLANSAGTSATLTFSNGDGALRKIVGIKFCNPNVFSTTEQRIGTWVDGKPIYQITYYGILPSGTRSGNIDINSLNVDMTTDIFGMIDVGGVRFPMNYVGDVSAAYSSLTSYFVLQGYMTSPTDKRIYYGMSANNTANTPYYITIRYTKTTD